jgi:AraC family transcriptional regulator
MRQSRYMGAIRTEIDTGVVRATKAIIGSLEAQLIDFPAHHRLGSFEFDRGYLVVVLEGALSKSFRTIRWSLGRNSFATLPPGATHTTAFGPSPVRVLAVRAHSVGELGSSDGELGSIGLRHAQIAAATMLGRRLASELRAKDSSWGLAAEGLALQLLALAGRAWPDTPPLRASWLRDVRDLLDARVPQQPTLTELAEVARVHPVHLARSFRREYGVTVAQYARGLRLDWAAQRLIEGDCTLAEVAAEAGFADQSHFTRSFREYAGVTPGRYRDLLRREGPGANARPRPVAP